MTSKPFRLRARVSTESPSLVRPILEESLSTGTIRPGDNANEFLIEAEMEGPSAKELNRALLSSLRRAEKRTRLRAEWTTGGTTERYFDYALQGVRPADPSGPPK